MKAQEKLKEFSLEDKVNLSAEGLDGIERALPKQHLQPPQEEPHPHEDQFQDLSAAQEPLMSVREKMLRDGWTPELYELWRQAQCNDWSP